MDKLKIPPLTRVTLSVYFDHCLKILDNKSIFYDKIISNFPQIYHPEIKSLRFDMGDLHYFDPQRKKVIIVNTASFTFQDFLYEKYDKFLDIMKTNLHLFGQAYDIAAFNSFDFSYENEVIVKNDIGINFNDYLTMVLDIKGKKEKSLYAAEGTVVFNVTNGLLSIDMRPKLNNNRPESCTYTIRFISKGEKMNIDNLIRCLNTAHDFIDDVFEHSLTPKYLESIK